MSTVTMTIKRRHFDAILDGSKTVEYRAVKPHWNSKFQDREVNVLKLIAGYRPDSRRLIVGVTKIERRPAPPEIKTLGPEVWALQLGQADLI